VTNVFLPVLVLAGLAVIIWAIVDVARRPPEMISPGAKAGWIIALVVGTLLFGVVGVVVAVVYLVAIRPRFTSLT
jgi:hypothetical protein